MKVLSLVVKRTVEHHYTLPLDSNLGAKNLAKALSDEDEMRKYETSNKTLEAVVVSKKEIPTLFRRKKKRS